MIAKEQIEVTFFRPRGLFKKAVGTHLGEDGKPKTTIFWLGRDHRRAMEHARLIIQAQDAFRAEGLMDKHWTAETLSRAKQAIKTVESLHELKVRIARRVVADASELDTPCPAAKSLSVTATAEESNATKTLHRATRAYIESLERKNVSDAHKDGARHMMTRLH